MLTTRTKSTGLPRRPPRASTALSTVRFPSLCILVSYPKAKRSNSAKFQCVGAASGKTQHAVKGRKLLDKRFEVIACSQSQLSSVDYCQPPRGAAPLQRFQENLRASPTATTCDNRSSLHWRGRARLFPSSRADLVVLKQLPLTGSWCLRLTLCERRGWLQYPRANAGDFLSTRWN